MKKMRKKTKRKLSSMILLLLLTVVLLATSTYAWFTANTTVTIDNIDVRVDVSTGIQISADALNWKTKLDKDDLTSGVWVEGRVNQLPTTLKPTSTVGTLSGGRLSMFSGEVKADDSNGEFVITTTPLTEADGTSGAFIAFDIFLRTEALTTDVYLTTDSKVDRTGATIDKGLKNAARVAFANLGTTVSTDSAENIRNLSQNNGVVIWEPNAGSHTAHGVAAAKEYYNINTQESDEESSLPYEGAVSAGENIPIKETNTSDHFAPITASIVYTNKTHGYVKLLTLTEGVTKFRVYMWIEGQDVDCENNASGTDITFNLSLSTNSEAPTG